MLVSLCKDSWSLALTRVRVIAACVPIFIDEATTFLEGQATQACVTYVYGGGKSPHWWAGLAGFTRTVDGPPTWIPKFLEMMYR